jgi:hypothetical protein
MLKDFSPAVMDKESVAMESSDDVPDLQVFK